MLLKFNADKSSLNFLAIDKSSILEERNTNGSFEDIFDFALRTNSRTVNKKTYESLALAGSFDDLEDVDRKKYIYSNENELSFIEKAISYSNKLQKEKETKQTFLFNNSEESNLITPEIPEIEPFSEIEKLKFEKELLGISGSRFDYLGTKGVSAIDFRADNETNFESLEENSIDLYASFKSLYLQNRENKIKNSSEIESEWGNLDN